MDRNISILGLVLTPSENHQFSMSLRTAPGTIKVLWTLGAWSSARTVCPLEDCLFFVHSAGAEAVVLSAPSSGLVASHPGLLFPVWDRIILDKTWIRARAEQRPGWRESTGGLAKEDGGNCLFNKEKAEVKRG